MTLLRAAHLLYEYKSLYVAVRKNASPARACVY